MFKKVIHNWLSRKNPTSYEIKRKDPVFSPINSFLKILPKNLNSNYKESAEKIINNNIFTLRNFGSIQYPENVNWEEDFGKGRSYLRLFNGFVWLGDIVKAFNENNDLEYVEKALALIYDWKKKNPYEGPSKKMTWHDETTALRLLHWVSFYNTIHNKIENEKVQELLIAMEEHAEILSKDEFYAGKNNHGMFQDFAILVYSYLFYSEDIEPLIKKAKARLREYFDFIISSEGIHKEHTPVYHYLIASNMKKYGECFAAIDKEFSNYLLNKYNQTLSFAIHIVKPNGYFPQIGDNNNVSPKGMRFSSIYNSEEYKYAITAGEVGRSPKQTNVVYQDSGYAIFRDSWVKKSKGTYILFNAAYHTEYHKHSDDLSFILYSNGDIFIDSGPNGYEYTSKFTKYGYSSFAHNTLIVDNKGLPRVDSQFDKTNITSFSLEEDYSEVTGVTNRYEGVTYERTLRYDHKQTISLVDVISSESEHEYNLLFHLAGDIKPVNEGDNIILLRSNEIVAKMKFKSKSKVKWDFVYGEEDEDQVLGWHFKKFNSPEKNYVIKLSLQEANARVETVIELNNN